MLAVEEGLIGGIDSNIQFYYRSSSMSKWLPKHARGAPFTIQYLTGTNGFMTYQSLPRYERREISRYMYANAKRTIRESHEMKHGSTRM